MILLAQWGVQDSNLRRHRHQIYSLTPLTARETPLHLILKTGHRRLAASGSLLAAIIRTEGRPPSKKTRGFDYELAEGLEPTTC